MPPRYNISRALLAENCWTAVGKEFVNKNGTWMCQNKKNYLKFNYGWRQDKLNSDEHNNIEQIAIKEEIQKLFGGFSYH